MEFVGREEIEEDSTEIGKQRERETMRVAGLRVDRPVDRRRDRSTGQSTNVHGVHKYSPVDRPVDRGMERSTARSTD